MMIRSRSRLMPASTRNGVSRIAAAPGPPAMKTTGSGSGLPDAAGTIATASRMVRPSGLERFSGTTRYPHRAACRAGMGSAVAGQGADSKRGVAADSAAGAFAGENASAVSKPRTISREKSEVETSMRSESIDAIGASPPADIPKAVARAKCS